MKGKKVIITCFLSTAFLITANVGFAFQDTGKALENWYNKEFKLVLNESSSKVDISSLSVDNANSQLECNKNKLIETVKDEINESNKMIINDAENCINKNLKMHLDKIETKEEELIKKNGFIEKDFDQYVVDKKGELDKELNEIIDEESKKLLCELKNTAIE